MKSLITRMDKHLTFTEAQQYKMRCCDEIMEYLRLEPKRSGLNVVLYVDDGNAYKRHGHQLLLFIRNGYSDTEQEYIPMSISSKPYVLDDDMEFRVSYDDIFDVMDFIQSNVTLLTELGNGKIDAELFIQSIRKIEKGIDRLVVEETQLSNIKIFKKN